MSPQGNGSDAHTLEGMEDRYGADVLAKGWQERAAKKIPQVPAEREQVPGQALASDIFGVASSIAAL